MAEKLKTIKGAEGDGAIEQPAATKLSESVLKSYVGDDTPPVAHERAAAADLISELDPESVTRVETTGPDDDTTVVETSGDGGSPGARMESAAWSPTCSREPRPGSLSAL